MWKTRPKQSRKSAIRDNPTGQNPDLKAKITSKIESKNVFAFPEAFSIQSAFLLPLMDAGLTRGEKESKREERVWDRQGVVKTREERKKSQRGESIPSETRPRRDPRADKSAGKQRREGIAGHWSELRLLELKSFHWSWRDNGVSLGFVRQEQGQDRNQAGVQPYRVGGTIFRAPLPLQKPSLLSLFFLPSSLWGDSHGV
jgi:hypothetical protein